jgi:hypothetical protein
LPVAAWADVEVRSGVRVSSRTCGLGSLASPIHGARYAPTDVLYMEYRFEVVRPHAGAHAATMINFMPDRDGADEEQVGDSVG